MHLKEVDLLKVVEEPGGIKLVVNDPEFAEWAEAYKKANTNYKNRLLQLAK